MIELFGSFLVVTLVLAGISGVSYHLLRDGGWIETLLGNIWEMETQYPMIAIPVTITAFILYRLWRRGQVIHGRTSRIPDLLVYALMAGGAYFIGHYFITGTL